MTTVLVARPLWPVLRGIVPFLAAEGYRVEEAPSWSRLVDAQLSCPGLAGVFLGEHGAVTDEVALLRRFREREGSTGVPVILVGGRNALLRAARFREAGGGVGISAGIPPDPLLGQGTPRPRLGD